MAPTNITEAYAEISRKASALKIEKHAVARTCFEEGVKELFDKYSEMQSFEWPQYTMYFNDGEPTFFSVYDESITINGINIHDDRYEDPKYWSKTGVNKIKSPYSNYESEYPVYELTEEGQKIEELIKIVCDFINQFDYEDLEHMLGEGKIVVTRDEIKTEEYNHD